MSIRTQAAALAEAIAAVRVRLAAAESELADLCVQYADARAADGAGDVRDVGEVVEGSGSVHRPRPGAFAADEVSILIGRSSWETSRLLACTRRIRSGLPTVSTAARSGQLDATRIHLIDQAARLVREPHTLAVLDEQVVEAAAGRTPQQLRSWLQRFLARHEPEEARHRRQVRFGDRRVTVAQSVTGIGYVTGEVSAEDAAAIDGRLCGLARALGAADPRTEQQRRSDLFAGLLLGTTVIAPGPGAGRDRAAVAAGVAGVAGVADVLEVESVDPDTGEYLGTRLVALDGDGHPLGEPARRPVTITEHFRGPTRIGVVVPMSSLLSLDDSPGELADRSGSVPADVVREIAGQPGALFTRLLTDDHGHLLDATELGRFASDRLAELIRLRAGSCVFPTCRTAATRCDLDHHEPHPIGPTSAANLDPLCRRHHRGKTFAGLAAHRDQHTVTWTMPTAHSYRCTDEPLPVPGSVRVQASDPIRGERAGPPDG